MATSRRAKQPTSPSTPLHKNIPLYRNSDLSYVSTIPAHQKGGRTSSRTRAGLRWTRAALKARLLRAGRDEPREHATDRDRRTAPKPCEASRRSRVVRVRRNRVVLAVVATVKPRRRRHCVDRRGAVNFAKAREARKNSAPGRARHRPSNHRAGKAWFRLPCVSPVHCVCNPFSMGVLWVPAGARSSLRPFFPGGCDEKHSSGKSCREDASACRSAGGVVAFQIEHFRER
jgi:hypothetical protein